MSKFIEHGPCPKCSKTGQGKSLAVYDDGVYCHECGYSDKETEMTIPSNFIQGTYPEILPGRGIDKAICEKFDYRVGTYTGNLGGRQVVEEKVHIANIHNKKGELVAQQLRDRTKSFTMIGNAKGLGLVGTHLYNPNPNVFVTIVEGYIDQLSVAQACGSQFPVVTVPAGTGSGEQAIKQDLDWLQGFKYVVLAFDNDEAGKELLNKVTPLFSPGKVRVATWPQKDANDLVKAGLYAEVKHVLFNAIEYKPEGVVDIADIPIEDIEEIFSTGIDLPFPKLNRMIRGLKAGKLYGIVAREKAGKSLFTKEIVLSLIDQGHKVGLIYLEEGAGSAGTSLVAMSEHKPMWEIEEHQDIVGGAQGIKDRLEKLRGKVCTYRHRGAIDLDSVLNVMHYMAKGYGAEFIVFDNATMAIAGTDATKNERKLIDNLVFKCVSLVNDTGSTIIYVSHLVKNRKNSDGEDIETVSRADIRGSGALAMFGHAIIGLERSGQSTLKLSVLANRSSGEEGYADTLHYNSNTGRLTIAKDIQEII